MVLSAAQNQCVFRLRRPCREDVTLKMNLCRTEEDMSETNTQRLDPRFNNEQLTLHCLTQADVLTLSQFHHLHLPRGLKKKKKKNVSERGDVVFQRDSENSWISWAALV